MVSVACFRSPHRGGAADHGVEPERPEIASIKTVGSSRVHHEQLAWSQLAATEPGWEQTPPAVARTRDTRKVAVNGHSVTKTADALAADGGNALDQRHAVREIGRASCREREEIS